MQITKMSYLPDDIPLCESMVIDGSIPFTLQFKTFGADAEKQQRKIAKAIAKYYNMELGQVKVNNTFKFSPK